jgi:hypothetical protein
MAVAYPSPARHEVRHFRSARKRTKRNFPYSCRNSTIDRSITREYLFHGS